MQDDGIPEEDEESEREAQLLLVELETMKAVEQTHMLQQVDACSLHTVHVPYRSHACVVQQCSKAAM